MEQSGLRCLIIRNNVCVVKFSSFLGRKTLLDKDECYQSHRPLPLAAIQPHRDFQSLENIFISQYCSCSNMFLIIVQFHIKITQYFYLSVPHGYFGKRLIICY